MVHPKRIKEKRIFAKLNYTRFKNSKEISYENVARHNSDIFKFKLT